MNQTQLKRLNDALNELTAASEDAEKQDTQVTEVEEIYNSKAAVFGNDARIPRDGERISKAADAVMAQQNQAIALAKSALQQQIEISREAHLRLDAAANEYKNAGIAALQTGAIEKV